MNKNQKFISRRTFLNAVSALALASATGSVLAQSFPSRPIKIIVAFAPGTGSDALARFIANGMQPALGGASVIVDNRAGGGGIVGTEAAAKSAPDGYTLTLGTTSTLITNPILNPNTKYNVEKDFAPVAGLARASFVIVTANRPDAPKSIGELVSQLKRQDGMYASSGAGTITHLASELFIRQVGVSATHVPYKGSGQALTDVAAGHVLFASDTLAAALPLIRAGKLRALAVTSSERIASLPDVPTARESGYQGVQVHAWWGLLAPAGTPPAVVKQLSDAALRAMGDAEIRAKLKTLELEPMEQTPQQFGAFIRQETPFWSEFIRRANIRLEQ
ncbi:MAG: Tripartite tricarboxylate transporter family receptor [Herminiimonas sp.]|nr:Tripartite tricarboxylate transporter family receptor [Herminiimonas sp.]